MRQTMKPAIGLFGAVLLGAGLAFSANAQPAKPEPLFDPDLVPNVVKDCYLPLKKLLSDGAVSPDQTLSSTGLSGCQVAGADEAKVGDFVEKLFVPRQVGVSP